MNTSWLEKASLYEFLALGLRYPDAVLVKALAEGEFADALEELSLLNGLDAVAVSAALKELEEYKGANPQTLLQSLRVEYTSLFIGQAAPLVSPYAGIWWAREAGVQPLLFVNKESLAVKSFMRSCGLGQPEGTNEPLDHIATELEFLHYLCLLRGGAALPPELPEDFSLPTCAYKHFYEEHFTAWSKLFAAAVAEKARIPFYRALARILTCL